MLKLTDDELTHLFQAAAPIAIERRDDFLEAVAAILTRLRRSDGPGTVHRAIAKAQRFYFDPPENDRTPSRARWDRDAPRFEKVSKQAAGCGSVARHRNQLRNSTFCRGLPPDAGACLLG